MTMPMGVKPYMTSLTWYMTLDQPTIIINFDQEPRLHGTFGEPQEA